MRPQLPTPDSRDVLVGLYLYASRMPGVTNHRYFRGPHYVKTCPTIQVASRPSLAWQSEDGSNSKRVDDHSGEADLDGRGESVAHSAVCKCASVLGCATIIRTIAIGRAALGPFVWSASILLVASPCAIRVGWVSFIYLSIEFPRCCLGQIVLCIRYPPV